MKSATAKAQPSQSARTTRPSISPATSFSMYPTKEELSISYFVTNYICNASDHSNGYLAYFPEVYRHDGVSIALMTSTRACGLVNLATANKSPQVMFEARKEYAKALRSINFALRDPVEVLKDSTLLAILLVSMYEMIAGNEQASLKAWTEQYVKSHVCSDMLTRKCANV